MKYPLKLIEWEDASCGNHKWTDIDTLPETLEPYIATTVGFLVKEDDQRIMLAMQLGEGTVADLMTIPRALIRREKTLSARFR